ncbi:MAG: DNA-binding transcriptional MerR regulator [Glaciecola sp.]|jgi:DNA-binding transcriptional MerR regulator|uniref:MerR family transcriptional regulator n=1 Tax=Congregibacter sp. TaxID=2744308 RepID=UPI0039E662BC
MNGTQKHFSISELSRELEISTRTIRFYEEKGFIKPLRSGQRRIYSAADRARIRLILRGKRIGLSLAESVEIIDMYQPGESDSTQLASLLARVSKRRAALEQQRKDLDDMLTALDEVEDLCREAQSKHHNEHTQETLMA